MENQKPNGPSLEYVDIINATRILEAAIERKAFQMSELGEIAPIVARFQEFSNAILAMQEEQQAAEQAASESAVNEEKGE